MKTKKYVTYILAALLVFLVLFVGCGAKGEPDTMPADAEPAPTETPAPTPEPTPAPDERMHFDDFVEQYESFNDIDLNTSDNSIQEEFFEEIYMQNYTKTDALEDKEVTSESNQELLDNYIKFIDSFQHTECGFDVAVNEFMSQYGTENLTEEQKNEMYASISAQFITPEDIDQWDCDNEYIEGYVAWYNNNYRSTGPVESQVRVATPEEIEELRRQAEASLQETLEEEARDFAESQQWAQENLDHLGHDM